MFSNRQATVKLYKVADLPDKMASECKYKVGLPK